MNVFFKLVSREEGEIGSKSREQRDLPSFPSPLSTGLGLSCGQGHCDVLFGKTLNPFSPNSDQNLISPHNITDSSNIHVTRMNEMITKDGMS